MTLLIGTVERDVGYLSQDAFYQGGRIIPALWQWILARFAPFLLRPRAAGGTIETASGGYHANKLQTFPSARMAVAISGDFRVLLFIGEAAKRCRDIDDFAGQLPKIWQRLPRFARGDYALIIAIGWSEARGRIVGYGATTDGEMRPELLESGTAQCPNDVADGPYAKEIAALSARLGGEAEIERLHKLTAINTAWGAAQGRYDCRQISGPITMATVTRQGITIKEIARIDRQQGGAAA